MFLLMAFPFFFPCSGQGSYNSTVICSVRPFAFDPKAVFDLGALVCKENFQPVLWIQFPFKGWDLTKREERKRTVVLLTCFI